jgi:cell division protein FtsB
MARNRRKHANSLPFVPLVRWVIAFVFLLIAGLSYVYFKNQLHATGRQIKELEKELAALTTQNEALRGQISLLSSRTVLQRHLDRGFIKMVPITNDRIVRMNPVKPASAELRMVSNREPGR